MKDKEDGLGRSPMGSQAMGGRWHPMGVEMAGQSMGSSTVLGALAGKGGPYPVVWGRVRGVGASGVTSWERGKV